MARAATRALARSPEQFSRYLARERRRDRMRAIPSSK